MANFIGTQDPDYEWPIYKWQPRKKLAWELLTSDKDRETVTESCGRCIVWEKNKGEWWISIVENALNPAIASIYCLSNGTLARLFAEDLGMADIQVVPMDDEENET